MLRPLIAACAAVLLVAPLASAQQPSQPPSAQQPPPKPQAAQPQAAQPSPPKSQAAQQPPPAATDTTRPNSMKTAGERTQAALQQAPTAKPEDVRSVASLMAALYDVISGPAGQARDWQRFRSLFYPGAKMIPVRRPKPGAAGPGISPITPDDYATWGVDFFNKHAFYEKETHREVSGYGDLVNVLSAYETREAANGPTTSKGVNSLQLVFDGQRWWVLNIAWIDEKTAGTPVPKDFARKE
ncbi:nuclear transport factor 2 family protein [Pyxidicoccus sp. MSG2]|uniref:nuclear transport factor 2 family protein n=1 Tax=Pyxidicoccus sp. MSG2 TaxID=2996790 RepID=UPI0022706929|nr:nuclear transport factor 2 family protein [Pyxidicoccus sp. MSG2]MCY1017215.1 nuclear transport factor 2 family protein [Pyxidicoccus sp. MSG2]